MTTFWRRKIENKNVLHIACHMSPVTYHLSLMPTTMDPYPANSHATHRKLVCKEQKAQYGCTQKKCQTVTKKKFHSFTILVVRSSNRSLKLSCSAPEGPSWWKKLIKHVKICLEISWPLVCLNGPITFIFANTFKFFLTPLVMEGYVCLTKYKINHKNQKKAWCCFKNLVSKKYCIIWNVQLLYKKSRIREKKHLLTDSDSSTDAIGAWTKNTPKPIFFLTEKIIQNAKTQKRL